jgi:hypothetical protein
MTCPRRVGSRGAGSITRGRTVAIWGRCFLQRITASCFSRKAGRIASKSPVSGSTSSWVQSAVSPVARRVARVPAKSRPVEVAPSRKMVGLASRTTGSSAWVYAWLV